MDSYLLVPLLACLVSVAVASRTLAREPDNKQLWPLSGVSGLAAVWAFCEVMWNQAQTPETALFWARMTSFATALVGPTALRALAIGSDRDTPALRRAVRWLYAASVPVMALGLFTDTVIVRMVSTAWGWSPVIGLGILPLYGIAVGSIVTGSRMYAQNPALSEGVGAVMKFSVSLPLVGVTLTDILLPALGVHSVPRIGVASIAVVGAVQTFIVLKRGEGALIPEGVSSTALRALPDGVLSLMRDGRIRSANDRFADLVGIPSRELIGADVQNFLSGDLLNRGTEFREQECMLRSASGDDLEVSVSGSLDRNGRVGERLVFIVRDLREVSALRKRLLLSGRMAAVGALAAGIAHELNNPLAYVRSNLAVLRENGDRIAKEIGDRRAKGGLGALVADTESIIDESLEGVDRAVAIVRDVCEFSHAGGSEFHPTDLAATIAQSVRVARLQIRKTIEVLIDVPELPRIEANSQRLMQVFVNLLVNAEHAIESEGRISVAAESDPEGVTVTVSDDGRGISEENLDRIFDPFFTTKPVGVGTGLGLPIAFAIVRQHHGSMDVSSSPGQGTEFRLWLPLSAPSGGLSDTA